jgi:hypothetical protein
MTRKHLWLSVLTLAASTMLANAVAESHKTPSVPGNGARSEKPAAQAARGFRLPKSLLLPQNLKKLLTSEEEEEKKEGSRVGEFLGMPGYLFYSLTEAGTLLLDPGQEEEAAFDDGDLPGDNPSDPSEVFSEPWVGERGVTETVEQMMARERFFRQKGIVARPEQGGPDRSNLPQDPDSPEVSQWPPIEGDVQPPFTGNGRGRFNPQTVSTTFQAIQLSEAGFLPPDTVGSVGPTQIVVVTNGRIKVFSKTGVVGGLNVTTSNFFNSVRNGATVSDPRVRFDPISQRWFVIGINVPVANNVVQPNNRIVIGVSSGATITNTSSFTFFFFQQNTVTPAGDTNRFADYPTLGVDANALYIGCNMFGGSFAGTTGWVVRKSSLTSGGPIVVTAFRSIGTTSAGVYTPQGVNNDDPSATEGYFIGVDMIASGRLALRRVSNPGGSPTISATIQVVVPTTGNPQSQPAQGSGSNLDALDDRLFAAEIRKNRLTGLSTLWTAHNFEVNTSGVASSTGNRNGSRWYELQNMTGTPALRQSGTLFDSAASNPNGFWIPSVTMSGQGHMAIGASVAGATRRAEIAVAGRLGTDALGTTQTPTTAQTSSTNYNQSLQRWGDYSLTCVDPTDDMTIWTFQEWCNATNSWGVRVIKLLAPPPATPTSLAPNTVNRGATNVNVVVTGTSASGSGFFDPGAGFTSRLQASVSGTGVTVNSVTFTDPTHITLNLTVSASATLSTRTITVTNPDGQAVISAALLTVQSANVAVSGTITLEDCLNKAQSIGFEFRPQPSGTAFTRTTTLSATGTYAFNDIPPANYIVSIKGAKWLRKNISVNASGSVSNANATLKAGDANNDNSIDVLDLDLLIQAFDKCLGDAGFLIGPDFNCDDCADVLDLDILIRNFDQSGDS